MSASAAPAELAAAPARAARHTSRKGLWAGRSLSAFAALFLREARLRALVPPRSDPA